MEIKYNKNLSNYNYVLSFDLAKQKTGWALVDIKSNKIEKFGMVILNEKADSVWLDIYDKIIVVLNDIKEHCQISGKRFFVLKEKLPNQAGKFTTIASLQSLAQVHAIWELACEKTGVDVYDFQGVHSVSVKAFFKKRYGIEKPQKEDIARLICENYCFNIGENPLDITDAIACVQTLVEHKWNQDIIDKTKELKKEQKKYKSDKKIEEIGREIRRIQTLEV